MVRYSAHSRLFRAFNMERQAGGLPSSFHWFEQALQALQASLALPLDVTGDKSDSHFNGSFIRLNFTVM